MLFNNFYIENRKKDCENSMKTTPFGITHGEYINILDELQEKNSLLQASFEEINRLNGICVDEDILYLKANELLNHKHRRERLELGSLNEEFWYKLTIIEEYGKYTRIERYKELDFIESNKDRILDFIEKDEDYITKVIDEERKLYLLIY